ncbi:MAG TPA: hypothetical protein VMM78_06920 [Thermomicrobiales bacterium]|nr:hypothetical protein [Thermomicrobiales bacterium]
MDDASARLAFVVVAAFALVFLLLMRRRLIANYPDDQSPQMRSMLGFIRGMAILAAIVLALALAELARVTVLS